MYPDVRSKDVINVCKETHELKLFVSSNNIEEICKEILGEADFKILPSQVFACVQDNNGVLVTKALEHELRDAGFDKDVDIVGILIYLAYMGKLCMRKSIDGKFYWHAIKWADTMTEADMRRAVDDLIDNQQCYTAACHLAVVCMMPDFFGTRL